MNQFELVRGNTLIAIFDGGKWLSENTKTDIMLPSRNEVCYYQPTELNYHSSWDWLMPVIEKISKMKFYESEEDSGNYYPRTFGMLSPETGKPMFRFNLHGCFESDLLIEAAWNAVVDFIQSQPS